MINDNNVADDAEDSKEQKEHTQQFVPFRFDDGHHLPTTPDCSSNPNTIPTTNKPIHLPDLACPIQYISFYPKLSVH